MRLTLLSFVLAVSALTLYAQAIPVNFTVQTTGVVGLADGQTAQLNLLNPGVPAPATGVVCTATAAFVDAGGAVLKSAVFSVAPGKAVALDLRADSDLKLTSADRRQIRATISIPALIPPPNATTPVLAACKLVPTLEIFDTSSGKIQVILDQVVTLPSPAASNQ